LDKLNQKILDELKDEKEIVDANGKKSSTVYPLLDKMQTPCSIFATFESEEGVNRARDYDSVP
jgi:hypothetical protein